MVQKVTVGEGGNKGVPTINVGNGGTKRVLEGWIGTPGGNEQFFQGFQIVKSGDAFANSTTTVTNPVTVSVSVGGGAVATPVSTSWFRISGDSTPEISNPSHATVTWSVPAQGFYFAVWRCTRTDAHGTTDSVDVSVTFTD